MTERKPGTPSDPKPRPDSEKTDFARPDAEQLKHGAPAHEQEKKPGAPREDAAKQNDDAHGYSQDSGYQSSGGYDAAPDAPVEAETRAKKGNGHTDSDEQIRWHIQQRMRKERAPRAKHLVVSVGEGIVTLRGEVDDELERKRLTDLVRELQDEMSTRAGLREVN